MWIITIICTNYYTLNINYTMNCYPPRMQCSAQTVFADQRLIRHRVLFVMTSQNTYVYYLHIKIIGERTTKFDNLTVTKLQTFYW